MSIPQKQYQFSYNKKSIQKLGERLPWKYRAIAVRKLKGKVHPSVISMVKNGKRKNDRVMKVLIKIAEENDKQKTSIELAAKGKIHSSQI